MTSLHDLILKLYPIQSEYDLIRFGPPHDEGYLIPNVLSGLLYNFSPGVGGATTIEDELVVFGVESFAMDTHTNPVICHPDKVHFRQGFLGRSDSRNSVTLDTWKAQSIGGYSDDLMLMMDIEGNEYDVLRSVSDNLLNQFRIMCIEFHNLGVLARGENFDVFEHICAYFRVVHLHPNNFNPAHTNTIVSDLIIPKVMEMTFLNKRFVQDDAPYATQFPHPLDFKNDPRSIALELPRCWYKV